MYAAFGVKSPGESVDMIHEELGYQKVILRPPYPLTKSERNKAEYLRCFQLLMMLMLAGKS